MPRILLRKISPSKAPFDYKIFERELKDEINFEVKPEIIKLLEGTVEGWTNKPDFGSRVTVRPDSIKLDAYAQGPHKDQYELVVRGARAHIIKSRRPGGMLTFRPGYSPATSPGSLRSRRARKFGPTVSARAVAHPGFEGRNFYALVAEEYKPEYNRRIKNALQRATYAHRGR